MYRQTSPEIKTAYIDKVKPLLKAAGARFLLNTSTADAKFSEGDTSKQFAKAVVAEFPTFEGAQKFYDSPEYKAIRPNLVKFTKMIYSVGEGTGAEVKDAQAYLFAGIKFKSPESAGKFMTDYIAKVMPVITKSGGKPIAKNLHAKCYATLGSDADKWDLTALYAFPTMEKALEFWNSKEYKPIKPASFANADSLVIIADRFVYPKAA